jgi:hypothetical protein
MDYYTELMRVIAEVFDGIIPIAKFDLSDRYSPVSFQY